MAAFLPTAIALAALIASVSPVGQGQLMNQLPCTRSATLPPSGQLISVHLAKDAFGVSAHTRYSKNNSI